MSKWFPSSVPSSDPTDHALPPTLRDHLLAGGVKLRGHWEELGDQPAPAIARDEVAVSLLEGRPGAHLHQHLGRPRPVKGVDPVAPLGVVRDHGPERAAPARSAHLLHAGVEHRLGLQRPHLGVREVQNVVREKLRRAHVVPPGDVDVVERLEEAALAAVLLGRRLPLPPPGLLVQNVAHLVQELLGAGPLRLKAADVAQRVPVNAREPEDLEDDAVPRIHLELGEGLVHQIAREVPITEAAGAALHKPLAAVLLEQAEEAGVGVAVAAVAVLRHRRKGRARDHGSRRHTRVPRHALVALVHEGPVLRADRLHIRPGAGAPRLHAADGRQHCVLAADGSPEVGVDPGVLRPPLGLRRTVERVLRIGVPGLVLPGVVREPVVELHVVDLQHVDHFIHLLLDLLRGAVEAGEEAIVAVRVIHAAVVGREAGGGMGAEPVPGGGKLD
eukprot:CAMPEP_0176215118 /NCGR_PEP_ID=MMETSP0121_2-20121125/16517_1 /TAXON_ID=160619 /ORGANISM="Kryptoperidinium foliaceum, Strain CCMP 1326" /LENGTH=443 /DNA_ID=CAMNT_0017554217 /DNA_START=306 /DNA_END=1635 /DNA_ORIENTATION=-